MRKKKYEGYYLSTRSLMQDGASYAGGLGTRCETRENDIRCRKVKFLLLQEAIPSRSHVRRITVVDGGGIERLGSTLTYAHP